MNDFRNWLIANKNENKIRLFFDIETLQYNQIEGRKKPTNYKNVTYSVAIAYLKQLTPNVCIFPSFKHMFDLILSTYDKWKTVPSIELIAHNNNKYDNHFLRKDLKHFYPKIKVENMFLKNAIEVGNKTAIKEKDISEVDMERGIILEKRIKSSNNLELIFFLNGVKFYTTDNFMKTNMSIASLGKKLLRLGKITEDELKTDFDYEEFNVDEDMEDENAYRYAEYVFNNLTEKHLTYIRNDVIILSKSVLYYSSLFKGFDYEKITFTSNILEHYNQNNLTSFQLLRRVKNGRFKAHIKFTDYHFRNQNLYDYFKKFYSGGLNIYNTRHIGRIIENVFSIDINSSYPYVMHKFKVPTYYNCSTEYEKETKVKVNAYNDDKFILYEMTKHRFDIEIVENIDSTLLKQIFVKYYGKHDNIFINSYTIRTLEKITNLKIDTLTILSMVVFDCEYFGSREQIDEAYYVKTQGSNEYLIDYKNPYDITVTDKKNVNKFTREEVDNSKVILNGLYGIPALRPHFNLFRLSGDELHNIENGYVNSERNIIFSVFVTAVAFYNLLSPLHFLTQNEIDENIIYMDTDSLYMFKDIEDKIPVDFYDKNILGKWDKEQKEDEIISKMYVLNHKKYAFELKNTSDNTNKIIVKCGGIPNETFNLNMSFEDFIKTQFSNGIKVKNIKTIYNKQGTISFYPSTTDLELGGGYPVFSNDNSLDKMRENIIEKAKEEMRMGGDDIMYIESNIGTFSLAELTPFKNDNKTKLPIDFLHLNEKKLKKIIN